MENTDDQTTKAVERDNYKRWMAAIDRAGKEKVKKWEDRGEKIVKRYRDEREEMDTGKKYNILWSNIQTLTPAVYSQAPKPNVTRRFDEKDEIAKQAAIILEKAISVHWDDEKQDDVIQSAVEDKLLPGRGVAYVDYEPSYITNNDDPENPFDEVVFEEANLKYCYWKDFRHGYARKWKDVPWVAFRTYPDRDELREKWPEDAEQIPLKYKSEDGDKEQDKRAIVWKIWCKKSRTVKYLAEGYTERLLESGPAPLNFQDFFPCPKPLFATTTNDTLIPVPDYAQYQDQADELDSLTGRIDLLLDALQVKGVYDGSHTALQDLLSNTDENQMVAVDDWAMYAERGGLEGAISWLPIDKMITVLVKLYEAREQTKQELYEITGLSDILRGATNPNETAAAQKLKGQFGSMRLSDQQGEVARFVKDLICLQAEVIAEHFSPETLQLMTGEKVTPEVVDLLRNDPIRTFRIDIETDSTIKADQVQERQDRTEFLNAATTYLSQAVQIGTQSPALVPLLGQMLMFGVRGFKAGRELEEVMEQTLEQLNQPPQPDPLAERVKALEVALKEAEVREKAATAGQKEADTEKKLAEAEGQQLENSMGLELV